jgi:hypothetical protein
MTSDGQNFKEGPRVHFSIVMLKILENLYLYDKNKQTLVLLLILSKES